MGYGLWVMGYGKYLQLLFLEKYKKNEKIFGRLKKKW
jgi:hypothetical protein